jgi:putative resolvase
MNKETYVPGKEAEKILGVHQKTLYNWDKKGLIEVIRTPGKKRLYNVEKYLKENKKQTEVINTEEINVEALDKTIKLCYVRVSSQGQKDDLDKQKEYMKGKYPNHVIIEDIGSGINFNRKGIRKIIELGIAGKVEELVVANKDRLTRLGYELIEDIIIKYSKGKIIILNKRDKSEPEEELAKDVLAIMNVFTAKMHGLKKDRK